ncbi:MAG TPA: 5-formyltetrahydrofolate cyclo-ligase [Treponemataceae bacterium]|nr:5-formyltetrahydrofolate cyclo-ligase [Treponemataceae bacterium]
MQIYSKKIMEPISKQELRNFLKGKNPEKGKATANIKKIPRYKKAHTVFLFLSLKDEIDTKSLLEQALKDGKKIALPKMRSTKTSEMSFFYLDKLSPIDMQIEKGAYEIYEPKTSLEEAKQEELTKNDLVFFPGLAFSKDGKRLGRGKGFYDRYFFDLWKNPHRPQFIGLCYENQIVNTIPTDSYDISMDALLTEKKYYICR